MAAFLLLLASSSSRCCTASSSSSFSSLLLGGFRTCRTDQASRDTGVDATNERSSNGIGSSQERYKHVAQHNVRRGCCMPSNAIMLFLLYRTQ